MRASPRMPPWWRNRPFLGHSFMSINTSVDSVLSLSTNSMPLGGPLGRVSTSSPFQLPRHLSGDGEEPLAGRRPQSPRTVAAGLNGLSADRL